MPEGTQPLSAQPSPTKPRPNPIIDEPATACVGDFGSGASVRADSVKRDAHACR